MVGIVGKYLTEKIVPVRFAAEEVLSSRNLREVELIDSAISMIRLGGSSC